MRPFLNNGTTFTTCKPIAPQRPHPSEQAPKTPRIARAKLELGARSRSIGAATFDPPLPRARGLMEKVRHPTGQTTIARPASRRPRGLASPAPWGFGFPVPWAVANPAERPQAAHSGNETASEKTQQPADARAFRLTPQSTAPKYLPTKSVRDNASSEAEGVKGSTFFNILRTSTMLDLSTSRRGIRLILSMEGHSNARSSLGVHPLPTRSNGLRNALGP